MSEREYAESVDGVMAGASPGSGQSGEDAGFGYGAGGVPATEVCVMGLCETQAVMLQPRAYRFVVMPGCQKCADLARESTAMPFVTGTTTPPTPPSTASAPTEARKRTWNADEIADALHVAGLNVGQVSRVAQALSRPRVPQGTEPGGAR